MTGYFYLAMCLLCLLPNNYAVDDGLLAETAINKQEKLQEN